MPQQLIYTSAARGLVAGRSGYCTVARSANMREALAVELEQLSYYHHTSLRGGEERPIFAFRAVNIRGSRFYVMSRLRDAGLDFTGRTNFIAHHLAVGAHELRDLPVPAIILRDWSGWVSTWDREPELMEAETWGNLYDLAGRSALPASCWHKLTGDAAHGYAFLELAPGSPIIADVPEIDLLSLVAESMELTEVRDARRDYHTAAWQYSFTSSLQNQDNASDFKWRFVHPSSPIAAKAPAVGAITLSELRTKGVTDEERAFAHQGWEAPSFAKVTADRATLTEGDTLTLYASSDGRPQPNFRWFEVEGGKPVELPGQTGNTVQVQPRGRAKRYCVQAWNRRGHKDSPVYEISINQKVRLTSNTHSYGTASRARTEEDLEAELQAFRRRKPLKEKKGTSIWVPVSLAALVIALTGGVLWARQHGFRFKSAQAAIQAQPKTDPTPKSIGVSASQANQNQQATSVPPSFGDFEPRATRTAIPTPWKATQVGVERTGGSASASGDEFRVTGGGILTNTAKFDSFFFVHLSATNSAAELSVRLRKYQDFPDFAVCGIMLRESTNKDAGCVFIGASSASLVHAARLRGTALTFITVAETNKTIGFRLALTNFSVRAFFRREATDEWTPFGDPQELKNPQYEIGIAVASGSHGDSVTAMFDSINHNFFTTDR